MFSEGIDKQHQDVLGKTVSYFCKKIHFRCVTGSEFASDYNKSNLFYEQEQSFITDFCNGDSYYTLPGFYLLKVNNKNTKYTTARCKMCLKLTVRTPARRQ